MQSNKNVQQPATKFENANKEQNIINKVDDLAPINKEKLIGGNNPENIEDKEDQNLKAHPAGQGQGEKLYQKQEQRNTSDTTDTTAKDNRSHEEHYPSRKDILH